MRRLLPALLLVPLVAGCYKMSYKVSGAQAGDSHTVKSRYLISGLVGGEVDLKEVCPSGVASIESRFEFVDLLLGGCTCGIYQPLTIEVRCASGRAFLAVPHPEENVTWVYPLDDDAGLE